ncbi:MAG: metal-dependent hydrolase [Bacteroidetes bacterium]|nr:metal-dependent hydrolase [Bacteroidota bacterium]
MDSITHIVLGAAIGDRILGKKIGRKAAWIGALAKTFPDFDLLYSGLNDPRKYVLYHRSYTHSFFVELLTAFPMALLFYYLFKRKVSYKMWFILWITCLWCHSLLDMCTNYGTRLLLPFSKQLISLNNIAIADLIFTVPILVLVVIALFYKNESKSRIILMRSSLVYAILYLGMTFVNKSIANAHFKKSLEKEQIRYQDYMSNPTILNNVLWYAVVNTDTMLKIGEYSLLQKEDKQIVWHSYPIQTHLMDSSKSPDASMLKWFSQGFYFAQQNKDTVEVFIPKFGRGDLDKIAAKETFIFYYKLYNKNGVWMMDAQQPSSKDMKFKEAFAQLIQKIMGN